jgi:aryl-alcohol dehydrogenase-like predicted oxidoreductase
VQRRPLGATGLDVSVVAFGAGPVSGLMTGDDRDAQRAVVGRAIASGINWFDTAATYGDGRSEANLGAALSAVGADPRQVHVATKVRLDLETSAESIAAQVRASVEASLERLNGWPIALLQLHNAVTPRRGEEPTSITPEDVLGPQGVLAAMADLQRAGHVAHLGLTGTGSPDALRALIASGEFATVQIPFNVLNQTAGGGAAIGTGETDYGNVIGACREQGIGVFAIRVYAGGALVGAPPSAHTLRTRFFPLDLYRRDAERTAALKLRLAAHGLSTSEAALRFVIGSAGITSAIVGFGDVAHVDSAVEAAARGPLSAEVLRETAV